VSSSATPRPSAATARARIVVTEAGLASDPVATMAAEIRAGLLAPLPSLPSKYFYDARGAALFEAITALPVYDLLRNEDAILAARAPEIAARVRPRTVLELGSGSGRKTTRIVEAAAATGRLERLAFVDVHREGLLEALGRFGDAFPSLALEAIVGDFTTDVPRVGRRDDTLVLFLGSTIGNLHPSREAPALLRDVAGILGPGGAFLCGFDLLRDRRELVLAYDDPDGVTAAFNRNILAVVNARLGATFDPDAFDHVARWDEGEGWIEMRLRARRAMAVDMPRAGITFRCAAGDELRTEICAKWTRARVEGLAAGTGLALAEWFTDPKGRFADALFVPA
jgi:L-histidine N-alpha-methyltransferase